MTNEQNAIYDFLGHFAQALLDNGYPGQAMDVTGPAMNFIKRAYGTKPVSPEELAKGIVQNMRDRDTEIERFRAELDERFPLAIQDN